MQCLFTCEEEARTWLIENAIIEQFLLLLSRPDLMNRSKELLLAVGCIYSLSCNRMSPINSSELFQEATNWRGRPRGALLRNVFVSFEPKPNNIAQSHGSILKGIDIISKKVGETKKDITMCHYFFALLCSNLVSCKLFSTFLIWIDWIVGDQPKSPQIMRLAMVHIHAFLKEYTPLMIRQIEDDNNYTWSVLPLLFPSVIQWSLTGRQRDWLRPAN